MRWARIEPQGHAEDISMNSAARFHHIGFAFLLAMALAPRPGMAADADNGKRLAQRWCQACHVVTPSGSRASTDAAPPFATIAAQPGFDVAKITLFLLDPHAKMPNMSLTRMEAGDLAAYIGSLARAAP
jgi:mono/diheme cytochrome c family protein